MAGKVKQGYCWCEKDRAFPEGIMKLIPPESVGKYCICHTCLVNYKEEESVEVIKANNQ